MRQALTYHPMKKVTLVSAHFSARYDKEKDGPVTLIPEVEVTITAFEPFFRKSTDGTDETREKVHVFEFSDTPENIRKVAKSLVQLADECEALTVGAVFDNTPKQLNDTPVLPGMERSEP